MIQRVIISFDAKAAFAAFYAIFWGVVLASARDFRPFSIDGFSNGREAAWKNTKRLLAGILILNVFPALWFIHLIKSDLVVPQDDDTRPAILAAAFAALSVFAFLNLGYAFFGDSGLAPNFHTQEEPKDKDPKKTVCFVCLAGFYILFFPILAMHIRCLSCQR